MIKRCLFRLVFCKFVPFDRAVFDPLSIRYRGNTGSDTCPFLIFALQLRYKVTHKIANLQALCTFFSFFVTFFRFFLHISKKSCIFAPDLCDNHPRLLSLGC